MIYEHLQYVNFLHTIQYVSYDTDNYVCEHLHKNMLYIKGTKSKKF